MENQIIKKGGQYFRLQKMEEGFEIDREIGKIEEEIQKLSVQLKELYKVRDEKSDEKSHDRIS